MSLDGNSFEYVQNIFDQAYQAGEADKKKIHAEAMWRYWLAFSLKAIGIFGGIAIAAGIPQSWAQGVGITISVAVGVDSLLLNHIRLQAVSKADKAFKWLLLDVVNEHQNNLGPILQIKESGQEPEAKAKLTELNMRLKNRLDQESRKIGQALDEVDLKALDSLSLEAEQRAKR